MIERFLQWSAVPMEKPTSYGLFHILFLFIGLTITILLVYFLRKTSEKQNKVVLLTCGIFLLLSEIYKQLFYYYVMDNGSYQWWIFPFQLCSIPMYLCLIIPFIKSERVKKPLYNFLLAFNLMGGFVAFLEPSGLCHEYWTLTFHAFIWHMVLVFIGLYLGVSKRAGKKLKDYLSAITIYGILAVVAFIINVCLFKVANGDINMFYVGPRISPIIVFKDIATKFGWYVNTPIYLICTSIASFVFFLPFYLFNRRSEKNTLVNN